MGEVAPATVVVPVMAAVTGMVEAVDTMEGVATTGAATAIVHRHKVHDPEAAMVPVPAVAGMAIPAVAVAAGPVPVLVDRAAITVKTAVSAVADTAGRAVVIAE